MFDYVNEMDMRKYNLDLQKRSCSCGQTQFFQQPSFNFCTCTSKPFRLAPLEQSLAQRLRGLIGETVIVQFIDNDAPQQLKGTLTFVGKDFIELTIEKGKDRSFLIPFQAIQWIEPR